MQGFARSLLSIESQEPERLRIGVDELALSIQRAYTIGESVQQLQRKRRCIRKELCGV